MMAKYTKDIDRQRIIEAYKNGQNYIFFAAQIGVHKRTAHRIIQSYKEENKTTSKPVGVRKNKITSEMTNDIKSWIKENCIITLQQIKLKLLQKYDLQIHKYF